MKLRGPAASRFSVDNLRRAAGCDEPVRPRRGRSSLDSLTTFFYAFRAVRTSHASLLAQRLRLPRVRLAVASLCLLAQTFALVHLFAVRHVRCAEHGDMVHVERGHAAHAAGERVSPPADLREAAISEHQVLRASGLAIEAHQDDHCMALSERRDLRTLEVKAVVSAPPELLGELTFVSQAPPLVARALYRLAPKISPPAAG